MLKICWMSTTTAPRATTPAAMAKSACRLVQRDGRAAFLSAGVAVSSTGESEKRATAATAAASAMAATGANTPRKTPPPRTHIPRPTTVASTSSPRISDLFLPGRGQARPVNPSIASAPPATVPMSLTSWRDWKTKSGDESRTAAANKPTRGRRRRTPSP